MCDPDLDAQYMLSWQQPVQHLHNHAVFIELILLLLTEPLSSVNPSLATEGTVAYRQASWKHFYSQHRSKLFSELIGEILPSVHLISIQL